MNKCLSYRYGFTLIEVLLALSVFALAGIALLNTSDSHMRNLALVEKQMYAQWIAADQLVEVNLVSTWPPKNNDKGKVELASREWYWLRKVQKTQDKNMLSITIEVREKEADDKAITELTTFIVKANNQ